MVNWESLPESVSAEDWDRSLLAGEDRNVFQSFGWGEYKRAAGWEPRRWIARDGNGMVVAMAQVLTKSFLHGVTVGWVPGGPVFHFPGALSHSPTSMLEGLLERYRATGRVVWIRFHCQLPQDAELVYAFSQKCMRPVAPLTSGHSLQIDLCQPFDDIIKRMTAKHRYYVRKSRGEKIHWRLANDNHAVRALSDLYAEMVHYKKLSPQAAPSGGLASLCAVLKNHAAILSGSVDGEPITACLVLTFGGRAFYLKAAAGRKGRELSASYAMVYYLLERLQDQGVTRLDFGGIDPRSPRAEGVNHFKRGFGGTLVEYLGEWEWASANWLRWGMNLAMRYRHGSL